MSDWALRCSHCSALSHLGLCCQAGLETLTSLTAGSTALRDRLLRARGWLVVSLPYWEFDALGSLGAKRAYLRAKLPAGLFHAKVRTACRKRAVCLKL